MPFIPTAIDGFGAKRFGVRGNTEFLWIETIVDTTTLVPTEAEINTGTDLTCAIGAINGFTVSDQYSDLPDLCSTVTGRVKDGASLSDSSLSLYLSNDGSGDGWDVFADGDQGYLYHCPSGIEGGQRAQAWAMTVGSVLPAIAMTGGALVNVSFSPTATEKVTLPAEST